MALSGAAGFVSRPHAASDSRLLTNLIKTERTYIQHLHASVSSGHAASAALSAWGTSEAPDISDASARLGSLLAACADVQSTHVAAIEGYRAALKDVADREASIRSVVRDRDILVGRLIKASNKAASSSHSKSPEERAEKVAVARRELHACEEVLASEEAALVGVKRRTFKEALTMRMKTMGDAGAAMVDAAKEAILLLDSFDSTARQHYPHPYDAEDGYQQFHDQDQEGQHHQYDMEQPSEDSHATWRQMQSMQQHQHQQQQQHMHPHGHEADSDDRLPVNHPAFENSSVTPSQSASQVNQQQYSRPLGGMHAPYPSRIGEEASQRHRGRGNDDDDDDSDSDWDEGHHRGTGTPIPPPHQIGGDMATFVPEQPQTQPQQSRERNNRPDMHMQLPPNDPTHNVTPGPTPPAKEERPLSRPTPTSKQAKAARGPARDVNVVPMPEVPMAPRLNLDGVNLGPVPSAPKLYMPGASSGNQDESDSSADEANGRGTVAHRGGGGGGGGGSFRMRPSVAHAAAGGHSFDSSASGTARQDRDGARARKGSGSGGFFGRVGKLFKTDIKGEPATAAAAAAAEGDGRSRKTSSSAWETRTDANLRGVRQSNQADDGVERARRRQNLLRGPIGSVEQDSSDEEDQRDLVRHVNQPRPLWQTDQTNSDVGIGSRLTGIGKRASLRRIPSSASVTAGPKSWKAKQEEEEQARRAVIGTGFAGSAAAAAAPAPGAPEAGSLKKKGTVTKKKKTQQPTPSQDGGSEIGTQATRTRSTAASVKPKRSSVIVQGDASAGVRRSESLNYGSKGRASGAAAGDKVARRTSKRMSAVAPGDLEAKFNTSSWVTKSTDYMPEEAPVRAAAAAAAAAAPPAAKAPTAAPTSQPAQAQPSQPQQQREEKDNHPRHVPQPSAATSPPLKPALKVPGGAADLMRTGSISSSIGGGRSSPMPVLPPPISAPPPVTSLLINQTASAPAPATATARAPAPAHASLGVDSTIDGTGHLDVELGKSDSNKPATPSQLKRSSVPVPRIDMPASEPFKLDLDERGKPTTPSRRTPLAEAGRVSPALMTPGEASAYQQFLTNNPGPAEAPSTTTNTDGVRRFVDRSTKLGSGVGSPPRPAAAATQTLSTPTKTSRTYGAGLGDDSSDSDDAGAAAAATTAAPTAAAAAAAPAAQASAGAATANPATSNLSTAPVNVATSDTSVDAGSGVSRRKSVRMAPDVKLPPETPTEDHSFDSAFNNNISKKSSSSHQRHSSTDHHASGPGATLSARIAPPPPAPPRIHQSKDYSPVDLGATPRERQGWATRIGRSTADDSDSSDDEGRGGAGEQGADSYASARQAFNMASRSWGKATGSSKQASTTKKGAGTESVASTTGSIKKKKSISKKKSASSNNVSGYNPAIPLPSGMEVVGRSGSIRR